MSEANVYYSNLVKMAHTIDEFILKFELGLVTNIPQVTVLVNPNMAKALCEMLTAQIQLYEKAFGTLPTKEELQAKVAKAMKMKEYQDQQDSGQGNLIVEK